MLLVGLSGGIGSGKSTVGRALAARGAVVIDSDKVAREVLAPGSPGEAAVLARFGSRVARADGVLDRQALANVVFADRARLLDLEAITHPLILREVRRQVAAATADVVVVELPLLDSVVRRNYGLDLVVMVRVPEDTALRRAVARGMTEQDAAARAAAQPTMAQRLELADRTLDNDGSLVDLEAELDELWPWLVGMAQNT